MNEQLESTQLNSASITKKRQTTDRTFQPQQDGVAVAVAHDIQDEKQGETQESLNSKFADITNVNLQNNGFEYVDLKLPSGLLWAKTNLDSPSGQYNNKYFAWKAEKGYALEQLSGDNAEYHFTEEEYKGSKLVDSAYMTMKGNWRMPTKEDFEELFDEANTTVQFARDIHKNITGCVITSLKDSTAVLYLPIENGSFKQGKEDRDVTIYWTSDTGELDSDACGLVFQTVETDENSDPAKTRQLTQVQKYIGGYVRGVIDRMNINERQKHNFDTLQNQINNINVNFKTNESIKNVSILQPENGGNAKLIQDRQTAVSGPLLSKVSFQLLNSIHDSETELQDNISAVSDNLEDYKKNNDERVNERPIISTNGKFATITAGGQTYGFSVQPAPNAPVANKSGKVITTSASDTITFSTSTSGAEIHTSSNNTAYNVSPNITFSNLLDKEVTEVKAYGISSIYGMNSPVTEVTINYYRKLLRPSVQIDGNRYDTVRHITVNNPNGAGSIKVKVDDQDAIDYAAPIESKVHEGVKIEAYVEASEWVASDHVISLASASSANNPSMWYGVSQSYSHGTTVDNVPLLTQISDTTLREKVQLKISSTSELAKKGLITTNTSNYSSVVVWICTPFQLDLSKVMDESGFKAALFYKGKVEDPNTADSLYAYCTNVIDGVFKFKYN